ncbi:FliO/MopB family protein [Rubripirellula reticaptiva]|uniref:Flagellar biosynthesis protein, FliO n=1 Tax=Rubripirellula reticaptiva TaxID=2528013 RepID=A0A5C6FAB3_9BACT|nr:flagellar biosynthetic protein FliO [Rubripirellula reticaptiva]TWU57437.1 Flagellar biosynthesis protein, FliO [Rubripirellula reticaptiva]
MMSNSSRFPLLFLLVAISIGISHRTVSAQEMGTASVYARGSAMTVSNSGSTRGPISADPPTRMLDGKPTKFPAFHPQSELTKAEGESADEPKNHFAIPAVTVTSSLAVVLGLFAAMVWLTRKFGSRSIAPGAIPRDVVEHLGSSPIDARTRLTMIRCGSRILVLSQTATEVRQLSEITDPEEVRRLTAACLGDSKRNFASTLQSIEKEPATPGFTSEPQSFQTPAAETPRSRGRLFSTTA